VERLLETPGGPLLLDISGFGGRWWIVGIRAFDADGWEIKNVSWSPRFSDSRWGRGPARSLAEVLEQDFRLSRGDAAAAATTIERDVVAEWRARGGDENEKVLRRRGIGCIVFGVLGLVFVVAAVLLPLLWTLDVL
jgi:hypothetical protein